MSLKVAVDFLSAKGVNMDLNDVFETADKIVDWVMDDKPVESKSTSIGSSVQHEESTTDKYHKSDDLPF